MWEAEKESNQGVIYSGEIFPILEYSFWSILACGRSAPLSRYLLPSRREGEREGEEGRGAGGGTLE